MQDAASRPAGSANRLGFVMLLLMVAGIAVARDPDAILSPPLLFEDGRDVLAFFYTSRGIETWFRAWAGYVVLVPNLIGWLALAAPIEAAPRLLAIGSLAVACVSLCWIARGDYRGLEERDAARAACVLVLALMPVLHHLFWWNSIYSVWSANLLLVLLVLAPAPTTSRGQLIRGLAMALLIFSHALSLVLLPVFVWLAIAGERFGPAAGRQLPGARRFYAVLAGLVVVQQLLAVDHSAASAMAPFEVVSRTSAFLVDRVVFGSIFGDRILRVLHASGREAWIAAAAMLLLAFIAGCLAVARERIGRIRGFALALLAWVIIGTTAAAVVGRNLDIEFLRSGRGARLFWVQRVCFLIALLWSARMAWRSHWPDGAPRACVGLLGMLAIAALGFVNLQNNAFYSVSPRTGEAVRDFTSELARAERQRGGRAHVEARLERKKWSIVIGP